MRWRCFIMSTTSRWSAWRSSSWATWVSASRSSRTPSCALQLRGVAYANIDRAPAYLRGAVLNGARPTAPAAEGARPLRRAPHRERPPADTGVGGTGPRRPDRAITALRHLSGRQCEALTLRYYLELSEAEIAAAMGIAPGR